MKQMVGGVLVLLLACLASQADDKSRDKPPTPRAQFDALVKQHQNAQNAFFKALSGTSKPEDQQKRMKEEAPKLEKIMARFVELAEKAPRDPVAVDALLRVVQDNFAARAGPTGEPLHAAPLLRGQGQRSPLADPARS